MSGCEIPLSDGVQRFAAPSLRLGNQDHHGAICLPDGRAFRSVAKGGTAHYGRGCCKDCGTIVRALGPWQAGAGGVGAC